MKTLLLNASGEFLGVVPWQAAMGDVVVGNVRVLREYDQRVRSQYLDINIPAVVREINYIQVKFENIFRISHSKRNIFIRDAYECQYCGFKCSRHRFSQEELCKRPKLHLQLPEMDHVIPKSKGGRDTWENTVTSCRRCNNKKSNLDLADSGFKLRSIPKKPDGFKEIFEMKIGQIHDLWFDYLKIYF